MERNPEQLENHQTSNTTSQKQSETLDNPSTPLKQQQSLSNGHDHAQNQMQLQTSNDKESTKNEIPTNSAQKDWSNADLMDDASHILQSNEKSNTGANEGDEKTLSQFLVECEQEEKLQKQLLTNKWVNACRYEQGYTYQQVYSCITCYQEQIKALPEDKRKEVEAGLKDNGQLVNFIKPHGFCLGCMINCHENHEVIELYNKVGFRCDCGNSSMPFSCQLNDNKDYDNPDNYYNQTFFDCYCYCKKPHSFEYIDQFMIQCYDCEDWYHNQHLTPQLKDQVDEKYLLLCKLCIKKKFMSKIMAYKSYFHQFTQDFLCQSPEQTNLKRQKISDSQDQNVRNTAKVNCKEAGNDQPLEEEFDLIIDESFLKDVCECDECKPIFAKLIKHVQAIDEMPEDDIKLMNNLEGHVNDDDEEEKKSEQQPILQSQSSNGRQPPSSPHKIADMLTSEQYLTEIMIKTLRNQGQVSHEGQIYFAEKFVKFKEYFIQFLKKFDQTSKKITYEDVMEFTKGLEALRGDRPQQ